MAPRVQPGTTGLALSPEDIERLRGEGVNLNVKWGQGDIREWSDFQIRGLTCLCDEMALLGGKSGGKSALMRGWMVSGNPHLPNFEPDGTPLLFNQSYVNHPDFWGLILRKNEKDLSFFIREASRLWAPLGGQYKNGRFEFPSGSRIDTGHMADENSWHKYIGNEYQRVAIDEAGLLPEWGPVEELISCMRTPHEDVLRVQIVLASNSGGPGTKWLMDRYMAVKDRDGKIIPHDTIIESESLHPFTGQIVKRTRIWMFSTIEDNPAMKHTAYAATLAGMSDKKRRRAYFLGLWDAFAGSYFGDIFRSEGPNAQNNEPPNANHVISPTAVNMLPWWHRSMSLDWGYAHESAVLWGCQEPNGRLIIHRELAIAEMTPKRLGYEIAILTRPDLEKSTSKSITLWLSHDAFAMRDGDRTIAELIQEGIAQVLGSKAVHLPDALIADLEKTFEGEIYSDFDMRRREEAKEQIRLQKRIGITIRKAAKANVIGWQHCRELMNWRVNTDSYTEFDPELHRRMVIEDPKGAMEYLKLFNGVKPKSLPILQILDTCPRLIEAIPQARHKEGTEDVDQKHFKGKDLVDSLHYLVIGVRDENPPEPFESYRERQVQDLLKGGEIEFNQLVHLNRSIEDEWAKKNKTFAPVTMLNRVQGKRRMLRNPKLMQKKGIVV